MLKYFSCYRVNQMEKNVKNLKHVEMYRIAFVRGAEGFIPVVRHV